MKKMITCIVVLFVLSGCERSQSNSTELSKHIQHTLIDNTSFDLISKDVSDYFTVEKINISGSVALRLNSPIDDFIMIGDTLLAINRRSNSVFALNSSGDILWEISSVNAEYAAPRQLDAVNYNPFTQAVELTGYSDHGVFIYDRSGAFMEKEVPLFDFVDRIGVSADSFYYDTDLKGVSGQFDFLLSVGGNYLPLKENYTDLSGQINYNEHDNFNRVERGILYRKPFVDTTFLLSGGAIIPAYLTTFKYRSNSQDILEDADIKNNFSKIIKDQVPIVNCDVLAGRNHYVVYSSPTKRVFSITRDGSNSVANAEYLRMGNLVVRSPYQATDGVFFGFMKQAELDFVAKNQSVIESSPKKLVQELNNIRENIGDRGAEVVFILTPK
jgi:hypothetical protein